MIKENIYYEEVESPEHYNQNSIEVWEMMLQIWGYDKFIAFCEMNAFKYRMRMGTKPNADINIDLSKAKWYENKAKELREPNK